MRTFSYIAALVAMILSVCFASDANGQWPQSTEGAQKNSIEIGGRFYNRPGSELEIPLITDSVTDQTLFDANQATAASSGAGVELGYHFDSRFGRKMEFRTILANWDTSTFLDDPNMTSPLFPGVEPLSVDYNYKARMFSFELNGSRPIAQGVTLFAGPRFVHFTDTVTLNSALAIEPGGGFPTVNATDNRSYEAVNNMIGAQLGLNLDYQLTQYFKVKGFIRAGGYTNPTKVLFNSSQASLGIISNQVSTQDTKSTGTFLAETGAELYVDIKPGLLQMYGGYEATWIDGIALAPPQFLTVDQQGVQTANTLFMHAVTFGLRMNY